MTTEEISKLNQEEFFMFLHIEIAHALQIPFNYYFTDESKEKLKNMPKLIEYMNHLKEVSK